MNFKNLLILYYLSNFYFLTIFVPCLLFHNFFCFGQLFLSWLWDCHCYLCPRLLSLLWKKRLRTLILSGFGHFLLYSFDSSFWAYIKNLIMDGQWFSLFLDMFRFSNDCSCYDSQHGDKKSINYFILQVQDLLLWVSLPLFLLFSSCGLLWWRSKITILLYMKETGRPVFFLQSRNFKTSVLDIFCSWYGKIDVKMIIMIWISIFFQFL